MKKIWIGFIAVVALSFMILIWVGVKIYQEQPPIPEQVIVEQTEEVLFTKAHIMRGQNVWESIGGMEVGSIWGHGSYVAPDWNADWIHREAEFLLERWAKPLGKPYKELSEEKKGMLKGRLVSQIKTNTYDTISKTISISQDRKEAIVANMQHYSSIFSKGHEEYAIPKEMLTDASKLHDLNAFFFWTSWAASTNRMEDVITYTSNWPYEPLINNTVSDDSLIWSGFSVILLLLCISLMVWYHIKSQHANEEQVEVPSINPLSSIVLVRSQKAVLKYFFIVTLLIVLQVVLGIVTVHYAVEGQAFFGFELSKFLPYTISRTWHTQLAIFWIATAWLATGLFIAPIISGKEMKFQVFGINFLFIALLIIVVGSMIGEWLGVKQYLDLTLNFFFGHQGYEYMDLGRFWQIFLAIGLILWMFLVGRHIVVGIKRRDDSRNLLILFLISVIAIGSFFFSGLMYGENSSLSVINYWRWWLVHLWVEGFFEVFATAVIALLFTKMKLLHEKTAGRVTVLSAIIFLAGGIIGTLHHIYFSGTPVHAIAFGATFSALEVVPLTLVGYEIWENWSLLKLKDWVRQYKWPIYFFLSVSFWNMLGAGIFGFLINPPVALYYIQGLNTTAVHAHTALFGVYGMLGMGLVLFCVRIVSKTVWDDRLLKIGFWSLNIGLLAMMVFSVLPQGIIQAIASMKHGYWYARSSELLYSPSVQIIKWLRMIGDIIFSVGIGCFCWFVAKETLFSMLGRKS
ncbi:nitric-oxide reductase large subunit [Aquimarina sp. TRL1]|uniref:nitric-oxide reductase large subunit n=1 Tax=Aquimarina sp. (strain TRL1) TaxID=2736252 RepID=UPI001588491E|nr:nitric-oxide reductase large subunit [Aquimarina sp. TRL1]QKX07005.1 nitric-oxide reductase large subunit [Aquimarina sp. TRL1]